MKKKNQTIKLEKLKLNKEKIMSLTIDQMEKINAGNKLAAAKQSELQICNSRVEGIGCTYQPTK